MSKYVGGRIVPKHCGTWSSTKTYETLSVVLYADTGDSYMARKTVPAGIAITDTEYWAKSADYSAQLNKLKSDVDDIAETTETLKSQIAANVTASTDSDADYAAELVDARVGADGTEYDSAGEAIRGQVSVLDGLTRLYPFDTTEKNLYNTEHTEQLIYSTKLNGISFLRVYAYDKEKYYIRQLWSYHASNHTATITIKNESETVSISYTSEEWASTADRVEENIEVYSSADPDMLLMEATIDWSKINVALGTKMDSDDFRIQESCIVRCFDETDYSDEVTELEDIRTGYDDKSYGTAGEAVRTQIENLENMTRLYPFDTTSKTLYRPGYSQVVYTETMNGIERLIIYAPDYEDYWITTLYSYQSTAHTSTIIISNESGTVKAGYTSAAWESKDERGTEDITLTYNDAVFAKIRINWAKINTSTGLGLGDSDDFRIQESCIVRCVASEEEVEEETEQDTSSVIEFVPITDYYVTNEQQRIYLNEIARYDPAGFFTVSCSGATYPEVTTGENDVCQYIEFNFDEDVDCVLTISYKDITGTTVDSTKITVHCRTSELPEKKYMFIGDSLTAAATMQNYFKDKNTDTVTLYGTRGTAPYNHEGRSSWSAANYVNAESKGSLTNPFYNPETATFDFSYYMENNPDFADVDVVVIFLGRNDGYGSASLLGNIDKMVASIKAYNEDIVVCYIPAYNVACNNAGCGQYLQSNRAFNVSAHSYNMTFYPAYENVIPAHCNLDNEYDYGKSSATVSIFDDTTIEVYNNNVHPNDNGYKKFGQVVNSFFRYYFAE